MAATIKDLERYAKLEGERGQLERELVRVKALLEAARPKVLTYFQVHGLDQMRCDGTTLYLRRELWAARDPACPHEEAIAALQEVGLGDFAAPRINTQRLSAWARELDAEGEKLPPELEGKVRVSEVFKIGVRRS